jgi:hypothetical protein
VQLALYSKNEILFLPVAIKMVPKKNLVSAAAGHIEGNEISTSASENNLATLQNGSLQPDK